MPLFKRKNFISLFKPKVINLELNNVSDNRKSVKTRIYQRGGVQAPPRKRTSVGKCFFN